MDIHTRNTSSIGKPALILHSDYGQLSKRQKLLLHSFDDRGIAHFDRCTDNVHIKMIDLSCLTAYTGKEYSLFSRNDRQYLIVGTAQGISIDSNLTDELITKGYKWSGHTHVGYNEYCLMPSEADYATLQKFKQKRSVIYNSVGQFFIFGKEDE